MAAAAIKAINARIRSNKALDYFCSTHFWGPVSNFGIPLAAIADSRKSPELISGPMTGALVIYAFTFMRYSLAVTPKNYLLFACHFVNAGSQLSQSYRFLDYHYWGGKESGKYAKSIAASAADK
ncbi:small nuclear ribonucleoprotein B and B [Parachaetomium inaequale]|uniref:Mitochondrial pyruvate carrier n=1 Tax=Parachaetomium inaequale TaxID=2588326 RepID=A0AAN6SP51_9PEZI|nr:small nuclear ribonucleoprotein B and B [Parachaetomium inaequale]